MELDGDLLRITRGGQVAAVALDSLTGPPVLQKGLFGTTLTISTGGRDSQKLKGARNLFARHFSEKLLKAWIKFNLAALEKQAQRLERILGEVRALVHPAVYPAACRVSSLLNNARALDASLLSMLLPSAVGPNITAKITVIRKFVEYPRLVRSSGITAFVAAKLNRWRDPFDTIESNPLTLEQRLSVVVDENATLVLAGTGSGKTALSPPKPPILSRPVSVNPKRSYF